MIKNHFQEPKDLLASELHETRNVNGEGCVIISVLPMLKENKLNTTTIVVL